MLPEIDFISCFKALTGLQESETPFPWQQKLFEELVQKNFRSTCDIPTGLGKTSVIAVWLLALAHHAGQGTIHDFPRRMVYVVNRRTVVDQSTGEVEHMREALDSDPSLKCVSEALRSLAAVESDRILAISTLRGQHADNSEWRHDPARPAVIVGTVDMIGSRLLFSGYGRGFKSRPLHAGFLGQDTLLIHDEAHLEPAFQKLLEEIEREQESCKEFLKLRIMAMTATMRSDKSSEQPLFTNLDHEHPEVKRRFILAKKGIAFHPAKDEKDIPGEMAKQALKHKTDGKAILIYAHKVKDVVEIDKRLNREGFKTQKLTGTLRGLERDNLASSNPIFARFLPRSRNSSSAITPPDETVYLICTSAGEVGVNISGDHLVCDLTPFDSMAQRFGRVNRFGTENSQIDIIHTEFPPEAGSNKDEGKTSSGETDSSIQNAEEAGEGSKAEKNPKENSPFNQSCARTLSLLKELPKREDMRYEACPAALSSLPSAKRQDAFTPPPTILPADDILFDAWALTSVRRELPGRPPVADWLHGIAKGELPDVHVAWREEVSLIKGDMLERYSPEDLIDVYPIKPHEMLRENTSRVQEHFEKIAQRCPHLNAWVMEASGRIRVLSIEELVKRDYQKKPVENLTDCIVLLPPEAGGLEKGFLQGDAPFQEVMRDYYDVSDQWGLQEDKQLRCRIWDDDRPPEDMRLILSMDTRQEDDEEEETEQIEGRRHWYWYIRPSSADDDGSRAAREMQYLDSHCKSAESVASALDIKLNLTEPEASALRLAARWHDLGKNRRVWQYAIGNLDYPGQVLAKSGGKMRSIDLGNFRHEFGSILDAKDLTEFKELKTEVQGSCAASDRSTPRSGKAVFSLRRGLRSQSH